MSLKKRKEIRALTVQELEDRLDVLGKELLGLRFDARRGSIDKPSRISETRKDIARIKTIIREKSDARIKR